MKMMRMKILILKEKINDNYINNYKPPSKKVEKLISISIIDFLIQKK